MYKWSSNKTAKPQTAIAAVTAVFPPNKPVHIYSATAFEAALTV